MLNRCLVLGLACLIFTVGCGPKEGTEGTGGSKPPASNTAEDKAQQLAAEKSRPADFQVTDEELASAFHADKAAFATKYAGKKVEVTGKVYQFKFGGLGPVQVVMSSKADSPDVANHQVFCNFQKQGLDAYQGLKELARGQDIKISGIMSNDGVNLMRSQVISAGANTAMPVTPGQLITAIGNQELEAKYLEKTVVFQAKVRSVNSDSDFLTIYVGSSASSKAPELKLVTNEYSSSKAMVAEYSKTKVGSTVIVIAETERLGEMRMTNFRFLEKLPEGVKLPEIAKPAVTPKKTK